MNRIELFFIKLMIFKVNGITSKTEIHNNIENILEVILAILKNKPYPLVFIGIMLYIFSKNHFF